MRACLVHQGANTFMVPGQRTVEGVDEGQPTNERHGVELLMAQSINIAPHLISVRCPSPGHERKPDAVLAAPNRVGALARWPAVGGRSDVVIRRGHRLGRDPDLRVVVTAPSSEESCALEQVAQLASSWFTTHLTSLRYTT